MRILRQTSRSIRPLLKPAFDRMSRSLIIGYLHYFLALVQRLLPLFPSHQGRGEYVLIRYPVPSPSMGEGSGGGELLHLLHPRSSLAKEGIEVGLFHFGHLCSYEQFPMLTAGFFFPGGVFCSFFAGGGRVAQAFF